MSATGAHPARAMFPNEFDPTSSGRSMSRPSSRPEHGFDDVFERQDARTRPPYSSTIWTMCARTLRTWFKACARLSDSGTTGKGRLKSRQRRVDVGLRMGQQQIAAQHESIESGRDRHGTAVCAKSAPIRGHRKTSRPWCFPARLNTTGRGVMASLTRVSRSKQQVLQHLRLSFLQLAFLRAQFGHGGKFLPAEAVQRRAVRQSVRSFSRSGRTNGYSIQIRNFRP